MKDFKYKTYKRGQIVLVDFRRTTGAELRGEHFAIVLNKKDFPQNGVLTVVPLSSKSKKYYLDVGKFLGESAFANIYDKVEHLEQASVDGLSDKDALRKLRDDSIAILKVRQQVEIYTNKRVNSYAIVQNITTISKLKIRKYSKHFDALEGVKIPSDKMDLIDKKIIELYTR